jgi:nucleotide-binding universal stress UspA family protein
VRLGAGEDIAQLFGGQIIALFLNVLPLVIAGDEGIGASQAAELLQAASEAGDKLEVRLMERLSRLRSPAQLRRFDIPSDAIGDVVTREARTADTFVMLRPNGAPQEPEHLVEAVLFGSGRHLFLVPNRRRAKAGFDRVLLAWNGSRESARALAEALPYMHKARTVIVIVVDDEPPAKSRATLGNDAVTHLKHHEIDAVLHHVRTHDRDVGTTLIAEAERHNADLIAMGGYGHSSVQEWLLGGTTQTILHKAPLPLLVAH